MIVFTDRASDPSLEARIRDIAGRVHNVIGSDKCFVREMGFSFYVDLHIVVNGNLTVREGHKIGHRIEDQVLKCVPQVAEVLVHVEPEEELIGSLPKVGLLP